MRILASIALTLLTTLWACGTASAQTKQGNVFGATIRNPGSIVPEWWNEREYIPESFNGAAHIRIGSAGNASGRAQLGRHNCDVAYLYAAKSGKALTEKERDYCAMLEFDIKKGIDGDRRNPLDGFARRDIIAEMQPVIDKRVEAFRVANAFYFRPGALSIAAYDFATSTFQLRAQTSGSFVGDPITATYGFEGPGFTDPANPNWWFAKMRSEGDNARAVEAARMGSGQILDATNFLFFKVLSTRESARGGAAARMIRIQVEKFGFSVADAKGRITEHGLGLAP